MAKSIADKYESQRRRCRMIQRELENERKMRIAAETMRDHVLKTLSEVVGKIRFVEVESDAPDAN